MRKTLFSILVCLLGIQGVWAQSPYQVNPFIGTDAHGHTYPGATSPFGMVQLSPDTRKEGWDGCSGYHYSDSVLYGFSHTHLSGTGCSDYGDFLFIPTVKDWNEKDFSMTFSHVSEFARAGYYEVRDLDGNGVDAFLTTTPRVGFHRYLFPKSAKKQTIIIDLDWRDELLEYEVQKVNDTTIVGYRNSKAWNENQKLYFAAVFSSKIVEDRFDTKTKRLFLGFLSDREEGNKWAIEARVALSSVSEEGALENLATEKCKIFADALRENTTLWEQELGNIEIETESEELQQVFYTALYHCLIAPNLYSDVSGEYRGMDDRIHTAKGYNRYTVFSLWDTYRTLHPLLSIIDQKRSKDFVKTFLDVHSQSGELPMWELASWETHCMIGMHGVSVLSELYEKGLVADGQRTLQALVENADTRLRASGFQKRGRPQPNLLGLDRFEKNGYISSEFEHEGVSKTVEYAYNMYCVAKVAKSLGEEQLYKDYIAKAQYYKNLINPKTGFIQPKENGRFLPTFDPKQVDQNYTEGNGWHYTFYAPQDVGGMIELMGGKDAFCAKLDSLFSESAAPNGREQPDVTGLIGGYSHGNEPSQHSAYLYTLAGHPFKTQKYVRQILTTLYDTTAAGICGNDDAGQMSAWYVMSSLGLYPLSPVDCEYVVTAPLFTKSTIRLQDGRKFTILAPDAETKPYVSAVYLNGKKLERFKIKYSDILAGGELSVELSEKPVMQQESDRTLCETTIPREDQIVVTPYLDYLGTGTFTDSLEVGVFAFEPKDTVFVKFLSGREEMFVGGGRFVLRDSDRIELFSKNGKASQRVEASFYKIPKGRKVKVLSTYNNQYTAGGDNGLIDRRRGGENWKLGLWQGYWGEDMVALVELSEDEKVRRVGANFIQDSRAWIFMPSEVEYYVSNDGENFAFLEVVKNDVPQKDEQVRQKTFFTSKPIGGRFIKVVAKNIKKNPAWHLSAGEKAWIFSDEIVIE